MLQPLQGKSEKIVLKGSCKISRSSGVISAFHIIFTELEKKNKKHWPTGRVGERRNYKEMK